MSKILAQGMITLTQLYEGAQVILTPSAVLIPCDSKEAPKPNAYINAFTNIRAFLGTMDITSKITLGTLEYSDSTVKASKTGTKVSITAITTRTGYVDIPVSVTIDGETIDLGKHRFSFVKQIDGQIGQTGAQGAPGFSYTLNIKGGTRGVAYAANGTNPEPKTSSQFSVELLKNGVKVANPASISWTCGGNLSGSSSTATFTPTIKSTYNSESSYVKVSVKEFAASLAVEETIPIVCTKHADGLDWINEWNNKYVQVGTEKIITPKIFAGTKNNANELTGVAIGRDVLGGNANKVIGIVGYKKNTPVFSLDQDANFFVSSSGNAGDVKNGTNNAKGLYFDGNDLYISGRVRINGGSTIGANNTSVEEVINNSNLGAQANNKIDNLSIGGRNLIRKADLAQNSSTATYDGATNTWTVNATAGAGGTWGCGLVVKNKNALVPYGKSYVLSFEIKVPRACSWNCDVNNYALTGSSWAGNDNDITSKRTTSSKSLAANQWIKCWVKWENTNPNNTNKVDIYDNSNFGVVMKDETSNMTYQIRNVKGELGNVPTEWTPAPEDVQGDIESVNNSLTSKIDGIQIGGRNLATSTNQGTTGWNWGLQTGGKTISEITENGIRCCKMVRDNVASTGWSFISYNKIGREKYLPSKKYTISFEVKSSVVTDFWCSLRQGDSSNPLSVSDVKATVSKANTWTKLSFTLTTKDTLPTSTAQVIYLASMNSDPGVTYIFRNLMIEEGTKASSWTPAPEDLENAYTIILTNEAQVIPTDSSRKPTSSVTYSTDIQVYKGSTQRTDYTIGTINSANGITVSKTSSRVNFAVSTSTALTADGGYFTIPIAIDGKTFNKTFSWSCSKQGVKGDTGGDGQDAQYVILNGDQVFKYSNNFAGAPTPQNIKIQATAYGISNPRYTWEFKRGGETTWNTILSATNNNQNYYTLPHDNSTIFNSSSVKSVAIRCTVNGHSDEITIVKVSDGAKGDTGVAGNGINTITEYYAVSSSNTTAPTSWSTTVPSMTSTNKYLWNYEVIKYTNNTTKETAKRVIGAYGDKGATGSTGATGNGISKIVNYYLATSSSSGVTTGTSGWTTSVQAVSASKKYLWNYEVITYTNGSTSTTTPCIIGTYGDKGDNAKNITLTATSQVFKSTDGGKNFTPDSITIKPTYQNVSHSKWQHSLDGGKTWVDTGTNTNGVTIDGNGFTISKSSTLFTDKVTSIVVKDVTNDASVTDTITITKLYDVTDLKIGATNYLRQSGNYSSPYWGNKGATITNEYYMGSKVYKVNAQWGAMAYKKNKELELEPETEYILSAYIKKDSGITYNSGTNMCWYGLSVNTVVVTLDNLTTSWKQYSVKRKGKEITANGDGAGIRIEPNNAITGGYVYVAGIQIEKGNKATDWKPNTNDLENAYTIVLTNEAQVIPTNSSRVPTSSTTYYTDIVVYQGTTQRTDYTIGTVNSANGITVSKTSSRVNFAVSTGTAIAADGGSFTIPITIDGKTFNKTFSWSCSKQGNTGATGATGSAGQDAITIVLSNENHTFPCESNGNIPTALSTTCVVTAYKGGTSVTPTIGAITNPTGMTITKNGATLTIQANTGTSLADSGTVNIPISVDGKTFNKTFTWSKAKKGATGAAGAGAKTVDIIASSQVFKSTDGGKTFLPDTITLTPSLQNVTFSKWQYSTDGGRSWSNVSSGSNGLTVSGNNLQISKSSNLFTSTNTTVVFKVITNDSGVYDTMTIVKLYDVTELEIGGRNYIRNGKGDKKAGFFKNFNNITGEYGELTLTSQKTYSNINIADGFVLGCRDYEVGRKVVFSYDIMYTKWDFPSGTNRQEFWIGQRYTNSSTSTDGAWRAVTSHNLPVVGENGCKLNEWYHVSKIITIPKQAEATIGTASSIQFYNSNADVSASFTARFKNVKLEYGNVETDWTPAPEDVNSNIDDVKNSLNSFQNTVNTTFKDGIIEQAEAKAIAQHLKTLDAEKADIDKEYSTIYGNSLLGGAAKTNLANAKTSFDSAHSSLKSTINTAISDGKVTSTEKANVDSAFTTYNGVLGTYKQRIQEALDAISSAKVNNIQVGGRNLALGTGKATGDVSSGTGGSPYSATDLFSGITAIKTNTAWTGRYFNLKAIAQRGGFKVGDNLVLSVYIKADQNVTLNVTSHRTKGTGNNSGSSKSYTNFTVTPKWQQVWFPFVADEGSLNRTDTRIEVNIATGNNYIHWAGWKLEKGTKPSDWAPAPEDVQTDINNAVNNIQVGGRNLLKDTSKELKSVTFGGWDYYFPNNITSWEKNKTLTGNIYLKPTEQDASCMLHVRYKDSSYKQYRGNIISAGREGYSTVTITVPNSDDISHIQFSIRHSASSTPTDVVYYKEAKVEKGNKATDWTPAPEDIDAEITAVNNKAQDSINKLTELASDSKLTASEKLVVKREWDAIVGEKTKITSEADKFGVSKTDYESKYNTLNSYITPLLSNLTTTSDINGSTFRSNFTNYYNSRQDLLNAITTKVKTLADNAQSTANTANNTANTVNTTVNNNKNDWSNAYNRVKEWASGAVTGSTTINGGMITANTISVNKLAVGDFTNISQIDENLAPNGNTVITHSDNYKYFRFGNDSSAGYHGLYFATLNGGTFKVGDRFKFTFIGFGNKSISTAFIIRARYTDNTWNNLGSASYTFDTANKTRTVELQITSGLTAGKTLQRVQIFNEFSNTTGLVYMRNICINRMATGELIVDGSIKTSMIHSDGLNASVIKAGTISADRLDANTIVSKVNGGTTEINGNRIQTGTLSASKITTGTLDATKVNVTNIKAGNIVSGTIDASKISVTNLNASNITSGTLRGRTIEGGTISNGSTVIDSNGLTVNNGAIKIKNKAGNTVLSSDSNGNLTLSGTIKSEAGNGLYAALNSGGITFRDSQKSEEVLRIGTSFSNGNRDINGVTFAMPQYSDRISFRHIAKPSLENGWDGSETTYTFMEMWSNDYNHSNGKNYKGINVFAPMYLSQKIRFRNGGDQYLHEVSPNITWNNMEKLMGVYGDNGTIIGYKSADSLYSRIVVTESNHPGTGDNIKSWGNWNCSGYTVHNATFSGNHVNSYANTATRTVSNTVGVMAEGNQVRVNFENVQIKDGKAILSIPKRYRGINEGYIIASIVKKGRGDVWVSEEEEERFIIEAENDIKINIEIIIKLTEAVVARTLKHEDSICYEVPNEQPEGDCC